jgi:iron complex outermembrane receptor protein
MRAVCHAPPDLRLLRWPIILLAVLIGLTTQSVAGTLDERSLEELTNTGLATTPKHVVVSTASKYAQSSSESPSATRVVTAEDVRAYGYRTLAEVLRSLPGVYVSNDRNYTQIGVRGFGRPGDYNSRVLLLIDGVRINENIYDGAYIGNESLVDVDLVERVEFMPGPGSAIYGNNAFFGVINVITKRGHNLNGGELSAEYGAFDTYKARGSYGKRFDNGAEMLVSATGFDREGADKLYFKTYDTPEQNHGRAEGLDYDRNHSVFGKLSWKALTLEGGYVDRVKGIPTASFQQVFNDRGSYIEDRQSFIGLTYSDRIARDWDMYLRLSYHQYQYGGDYIYDDPPPRSVNRDLVIGEWWGGEFRLTNTSFERHKLVFGVELQDNLQQYQKNFNVGSPPVLDKPYDSLRYGFFFQDEFKILDPLSLIAGARYDYTPLGGSSANPRVGLIWQARDDTTLKLLYGTAFRAPNVFETFYTDGFSVRGATGLVPETNETLELLLDHQLTPFTRLSASLYRYEVQELISQTDVIVNGYTSYENQASVQAQGMELEGEQRFRNGVRARLSYVWQRAESQFGQTLTNSPQHQVKLNLSVPLWDDRWRAGFETQYLSERLTQSSRVGDQILSNLNVSGDIHKNLQLSFGVYNLWNARYADPAGTEILGNSVIQDGRGFRLKLNLKF